MIPILPRNPSFAEQLGNTLGSGISQGVGAGLNFAQQLAIQRAKHKEEKGLAQQQMMQQASGILDSLEGLVDQPGIGLLGAVNFSADARHNRGQFESMTAGILPMFKAMFPRGFTEREFKVIRSQYIPQPHDTEETIRGKIEGLKNIFSTLSEGGNWNDALGPKEKGSASGKVKFDISNPEHKAKRDQVFKKVNGNMKKAKAILDREFTE